MSAAGRILNALAELDDTIHQQSQQSTFKPLMDKLYSAVVEMEDISARAATYKPTRERVTQIPWSYMDEKFVIHAEYIGDEAVCRFLLVLPGQVFVLRQGRPADTSQWFMRAWEEIALENELPRARAADAQRRLWTEWQALIG